MDSTSTQFSGGRGRNGNQAKACHQLIRGRKKEESGGGRGERKERWRKPWLQGKDGGKMMHGEDLGGVRTGRMNRRMIGRAGRQITCSRCAAVVMAWCVGRIFGDEENLCLSLPPLQSLPMSSSSYIHSRVKERKEIREVKMAEWSELWSVSLPSPVSPQPPLSVLPQPVVFQSIGSQPSSHRACAMPGL